MKSNTSRTLLAFLATLALILTACGGGGDEPAASGGDTDAGQQKAEQKAEEKKDEKTEETSDASGAEVEGVVFTDTSGGTDPVPAESLKAEQPYKIAFFTKNVVNPFWEAGRQGGRAAGEKYGIEVEYFAPTDPDNVAEQTRILEDVIAKGEHDGIVIAPVDFTAQVAQIEKANAAGIPIYNFSNKMAGGELVCFYGYNDVAIGEGMVEWLAGKLGAGGTFFVLEGRPGAVTAQGRQEGIQAALGGSGLDMVATQTANYARTEGATVAENLLQANPDVQAILAHNDEMALGAVAALESAGRDPSEVVIAGIDATPDALQAIKDGKLGASVNYSGYEMGFNATECAVRHLNGERIEAQDVQLPFTMVEPSNVDGYIERTRAIGLMD